MKIGFIGLGNLGSAIAKRLVSVGEEVIVWNRSPEKVEKLGLPSQPTPKALVDRKSVV